MFPVRWASVPAPNPKLIATYPTKAPAVAVSRGLDRDRVVDESGNQTVVFGRRGSRPFHLDEMEKFYERDGELYTVENVSVRDGKLRDTLRRGIETDGRISAGDGRKLQLRSPAENERLIRRGQ